MLLIEIIVSVKGLGLEAIQNFLKEDVYESLY